MPLHVQGLLVCAGEGMSAMYCITAGMPSVQGSQGDASLEQAWIHIFSKYQFTSDEINDTMYLSSKYKKTYIQHTNDELPPKMP